MMTNTERMKNHLIRQFFDKPVISAEIDALGTELELLHQVYQDLKEKRWIDTGEGMQLDNIGTIVNRSRVIDNAVPLMFFGFQEQPNALTFDAGRFRQDDETWLTSTRLNDERYRKILWLKIFKDVSTATADDIIHALSVIFNAASISLDEVGNAKLFIGIGRRALPDDIYFMSSVNLIIKAGGVGIYAIESYDHDHFFGFQDQNNAKGFDSGCFADLLNGYGG